MACPDGHLSDVDWIWLVHRSSECKPDHLSWDARGSALRSVRIVCPRCGKEANLGEEYSRDHRCSGAFPERRDFSGTCNTRARIVQRGAANLYIPELLSAITVPRVSTALHRALSSPHVMGLIQGALKFSGRLPTAQELLELMEPSMVSPETLQALSQAHPGDVRQALEDVREQQLPEGPESARLLEFRELRRAASQGQQSHTSTAAWTPSDFEVDPLQARVFPFGPYSLRVTPVSRLRVVMAQTGYRRMSGKKVVSCAYRRGTVSWYPGVEMFGEGLFIDLAPGSQPAPGRGPSWEAWKARWQSSTSGHEHPLFVWWHTLAHRLIRALSIDSGYASASVRERVYLQVGDQDAVGGVLLYAVQPGGDGTLGGLIALVPRFERVLLGARRYLDNCSNDPLCEDARVDSRRPNGAACFACCLISETSCEHRNTSLDRWILVETVLGR